MVLLHAIVGSLFRNYWLAIPHMWLYSFAILRGTIYTLCPEKKSSLRVIAIPAELKVILKDHKAWQEKRSEELGSKWKDRGAVVTGMEGEYMSGGYLNITLKKLLKKHDLPDIHVHDLRHANASLLINAGVPVKFISEHLGHSNTKTTEDIYAHVYNSTAEKVASAISDALDGVI